MSWKIKDIRVSYKDGCMCTFCGEDDDIDHFRSMLETVERKALVARRLGQTAVSIIALLAAASAWLGWS